MYEALFGNKVAEKCLLYIKNYGEGHINGISKTFKVSPSQVERQLKRLEAGGILVNKIVGNTKMFSINPRFGARVELNQLLEKILMLLPEKQTDLYFRDRRRPRRSGKAL
jgi:hypothetical protein